MENENDLMKEIISDMAEACDNFSTVSLKTQGNGRTDKTKLYANR